MGKDIDKTSKKEIFKIIKRGVDNGTSNAVIAEEIKSKFSQFKKRRLNMIVRTEVSR